MMHIVRNAIDHGIELSSVRAGLTKPGTATLAINAYQKGNHVVIELSDDGRGIDTHMIRETAIRKGVMSEQVVSDLTREVDRATVHDHVSEPLAYVITLERHGAILGCGTGRRESADFCLS